MVTSDWPMGIREVAKRAKVSIATVSRTINSPESVDPITASRVWEAVRELNYFPNTNARSLVSGRTHILGLVVSDITNPFFPELIKGFENVATRHGFEILISSTNYDPVRMALCVRRMLERKVDGVAIMTSEFDRHLLEELERRQLPLVFLDASPSGRQISNIKADYAKGIKEAVTHLLTLGHRRIGFVSGPLNLKSARVRRLAFLRCLKQFGLHGDPGLIEEADHTVDGGLSATERLLSSGHAPTAILASNDLTAIGAMRALRRAGLQVPDDVSVVGFDDIHLAEFTEPPLTTVRLSRTELAELAFAALAADLSPATGLPREKVHLTISTALVVRESTGPVRSENRSRT